MKNLQLLFIAFISLFITSCQFTEEITFNKNGSGKYNLKVDMSTMLKGMGSMKNDSIEKEPEKMDSIIYFKDILEMKKDSISKLSDEEKAIIKALKDLKMHIHMDEEKEEMIMDYMMDFKDISQINGIQQKIEKAQQLQENKGKAKENITDNEVNYFYSKNKFVRKVIMKDLTDEEKEKVAQDKEQFDMFLSGSMYKLIYNFPKKIKKVSYPDVQYSEDHKSLTIIVPMDSLTKNPKLLDFEVDF
jgi:hypothetical protein